MKMSPEERQQRMTERNAAICQYYMNGATLAECGKQFGLKRQRIKQIVQEAGLWREREKKPLSDRDEFLGVNLSEADKDALRAYAAQQGISMSAMTADWIRARLTEIRKDEEAMKP